MKNSPTRRIKMADSFRTKSVQILLKDSPDAQTYSGIHCVYAQGPYTTLWVAHGQVYMFPTENICRLKITLEGHYD